MANEKKKNLLDEDLDEESNLVFFGIIIIVIIMIVVIVCCICRKTKNCLEGYQFEEKIPIYVTTLNNDVSKRRYKAQQKILKYFNFKHMKKNKGLHWKTDNRHIKSKYPMINEMASKFVDRKGAYGLTASFIQFVDNSLKSCNGNRSKCNYIGWMEDDVIPGGTELNLDQKQDIVEQINKSNVKRIINDSTKLKFNQNYSALLQNLPQSGNNNDIYFFGHTNYCDNNSLNKSNSSRLEGNNYWFNILADDIYKAGGPGTSFIIFTANSLKIIQEYLYNNKIDLPIDMLLMKFIKDEILTGWETTVNISENDMFYGMFEQFGTYCDSRQNTTID